MEIVRLHNIRFFWEAEELNHDHPELEYVDCVLVTFERQKEQKNGDHYSNGIQGWNTLSSKSHICNCKEN
jgi:hypothetical protein